VAEEEKAAEAPAPEGGGEQEAVQKKTAGAAAGNNQKFIMIVLILNAVVLVVVAILAVISIKKQSQEVSLADVAAGEAAEAHKDEGGHGKEGEKKEGNELNNFIKESFTVNLADSKGAHFAQVVIEIEVPDETVKQAVEVLRPKIRDFIVVVLSSKTYEQVSSVDGREFLREEIRNKINGHLPRGQIKEVHFTQFIVQ
jgi:flagellar FliL protein